MRHLVSCFHVGLSFGLVALAACKKDEQARARSESAVTNKDFWPEAPAATHKDAKRTLAYKPQNLAGYHIAVDVKTQPGAMASITAIMGLDLKFVPGPTPRTRGAQINTMTMDLNAAGKAMTVKLDSNELYVKEDGEETRMKRGDGGPIDVGELTEKPFTSFTFSEDNKVTIEGNKDHAFTQLGGDMMDTALVLFPDLPTGEISSGHKWTVKRNVKVGSTDARVDVTYNFEYVGDGACPSGAASCALFTFQAASTNATVQTEGVTVSVTYAFAGKVYFDTAKGVIDESRVRMDMDLSGKGLELPMGGMFVLKPKL